MASYELLIVGELGFVTPLQVRCHLLFEVFSQRYERGSTPDALTPSNAGSPTAATTPRGPAKTTPRVGNNHIESVITRRSAEQMAFKVGDTVKVVIKSTEVMLQKDCARQLPSQLQPELHSPQSHARELGGPGRLGCCSFNNLKS
jgi:hypothetical protein